MNVIRMALLAAAIAAGLSGCATIEQGYQAGINGASRGAEQDKKAAANAWLMSKCRVGYGAGLSLEKCADIYAFMENEKDGWKCEGLVDRVSCTRPSTKGKGRIDLREFYRVIDK